MDNVKMLRPGTKQFDFGFSLDSSRVGIFGDFNAKLSDRLGLFTTVEGGAEMKTSKLWYKALGGLRLQF